MWNKTQRFELIETLSRGYPFGSILISTSDAFRDGEKYKLIDGLQRFDAINKFKKEPFEFYPVEKYLEGIKEIIDDSILHISSRDDLRGELDERLTEILKSTLKQTYQKTHDFEHMYILEDMLLKHLKDKYSIEIRDESIKREISKFQGMMINDLSNYLNLDELEIPCIIFKGNEDELANVFENLNKGGVKLNKYQIFASVWDKKLIKLKSGEKYTNLDQVMNITVDRYEKLTKERAIKIDEYDRDTFQMEREINLFELCYALGKIIVGELDAFYNTKSDKEELINSIGFSTMAVIVNCSNKSMSKIVKKYDVIKDSEWLEFVIQEVKIIYKKINKFYKDKFNFPGGKDNFYVDIKNFQLLSFFASCWSKTFNNREDIANLKSNKDSKAKMHVDQIISNSLQYYFRDYINNYWGSAGDTKLDECYLVDQGNSIRYFIGISKYNLIHELNNYFEENFFNKNRLNVDTLTKHIIILTYNQFLNEPNTIYEFEHIIPKKVCKEIQTDSQRIPAGIIGNITLLDKELNGSKKDKFVYDYAKQKGLDISRKQEQLDKVDYIDSHTASKYNSLLDNDKKYEFINKYIETRTRLVIEKLIEKIIN